MKVVYLSAGSRTTLGGETRVALEISKAMTSHCEVAIVCTGARNEIVEENGVKVVTLEGYDDGKEGIGVFSNETIKFLFDFLDSYRPDVMHAHSPWLAPFIAQIWALSHGTPYFFTTHYILSKMSEFLDISSSSFGYKVVDEAFIKRYFLGYLDNCSSVIALNRVAYDGLREYGYKGDMEVIPNGRFLDNLTKLKIPNIDDKVVNLVFVGSITKRKNQEYLLEMSKYLPDNFKLKLIGRFLFEDYEKEFMKMAKNYRRVEVVGGVSPHLVASYLEESHIFVSASTVEVQALSVIEALAAGKPVVGLSNETVDELVDDDVGVWLDKDTSPKEFAESVVRIAEKSRGEYELMCKSARERVCDMDWSIIAQKTYLLYQRYLGHGQNIDRSRWDDLRNTIIKLPFFPGQAYLLDRFDALKSRVKRSDSLNIVSKVPKKTLLIAGLTIGFASLAFGGLKLFSYLKKRKNTK